VHALPGPRGIGLWGGAAAPLCGETPASLLRRRAGFAALQGSALTTITLSISLVSA